MKIKGSIIFQQLGKKFVAYDNSTSLMHEINEVGAFIIKEIKKGKGKESIVASLTREYDIDKPTALEDLAKFVLELKQKGILVK